MQSSMNKSGMINLDAFHSMMRNEDEDEELKSPYKEFFTATQLRNPHKDHSNHSRTSSLDPSNYETANQAPVAIKESAVTKAPQSHDFSDQVINEVQKLTKQHSRQKNMNKLQRHHKSNSPAQTNTQKYTKDDNGLNDNSRRLSLQDISQRGQEEFYDF